MRAEDRRRQQQPPPAPTPRDAVRNRTAGDGIMPDDGERDLSDSEQKRIKTMLAPDEQDLRKYKDFLKRSNTGLFRLFPNTNCESKSLLRVDGECENFVPCGSTYSFRTEKHGYEDWFDIRFDGANFVADAFLSQGIIVPLGDVPLEEVTLETAGMKFLTDFVPEVQNRGIRRQFAEIAGVVRAGDFYYSKKIKAVENTTYAVRIIAYSRQNRIYFRPRSSRPPDFLRFLRVNRDKRIDVIVAFRIVGKSENSSVSILWKELRQKNAPEIVFEKDEKLADFKDN
jgi:hypothetical protein